MTPTEKQYLAAARSGWHDEGELRSSQIDVRTAAPKPAREIRTRSEVALDDVSFRWRIPELRATMYRALLVVIVAARLIDLLVISIVGNVSDAGSWGGVWADISVSMTMGLASIVALVDFVVRVVRIQRRPAPDCGDWVPAASREFFRETAQSIFATHNMLCSWAVWGGTVGVIAGSISTGEQAWKCLIMGKADGNCLQLHEICESTQIDICHLVFFFESMINWSTAIWAMTLTFLIVGTPICIWQPVLREAISQSKSRRLKRLQKLPLVVLATDLLFVASLGHSFTIDDMHPGLTRTNLELHFWFATSTSVFTFLVALWSGAVFAAWGTPLRLLRDSLRPALLRLSRMTRRVTHLPRRRPIGQVISSSLSIKRFSEWWSSRGHVAEVGLQQLRFSLVICGCMIFNASPVPSSLPPAVFWPLALIMWGIRVGLVVTLLAARDKPVDFDGLEESTGAGMGLVVYRRDLKRALEALLAGTDLSQSEDLPRFKATALRLKGDTLAVSYRWTSHRRPLGQSTAVNLSDFQIRALLRALDKAPHMYVWIDVLSMPQYASALQTTLLSRMMGVYSGARTVLGIRTVEGETSRYHQRAWVLQEYCSAKTLLMVDEAEVPGEAEEGRWAYTSQELKFFHDLRAKVQRAIPTCRPFWLSGGLSCAVPEEEVQWFVDKYQELSSLVWCQDEGDKLRALVPLLANTPVATQAELVALLEQVMARLGVELGGWASMGTLNGPQDISVAKQ